MHPLTKQSDDTTPAPSMSPESFCRWLEDMKAAGIAASDAAAARALGITPRGLLKLKTRGADRRTALACSALLAGIPPYSEL